MRSMKTELNEVCTVVVLSNHVMTGSATEKDGELGEDNVAD